ncbi:MAG TPA: DNA-binding protein [Burkholderiales bacterium]|nr:DNA-binding protein [Burkholderiales bacterium]
MSLQNLLKTGQLKEHPPDAAEVQRLLAAAERNLVDARVTTISPETRFDAAYKAAMQAALAALMAHGYRPDASRPGHHMTVLQALTLTIGLAPARVTLLDTLRRKRNLSDYTGDDIDDSSAEHCIAETDRLLQDVTAWLKAHRPQLIAPQR